MHAPPKGSANSDEQRDTAAKGRTAGREITRTDRLPIDRLLEKLRSERQQRAHKDRCLSMISHELRSPLASIQLSHDLLAQYSEQATEEERLHYLDNIRLQVANLNEIVRDVVDLSKSTPAELDFSPARRDLATLCRDIIESFELVHHHTHQFVFDSPAVEITGEFDVKLLRRALSNLVGNAVKYSPAGGEIRLAICLDGQLAHITVSDQGIGIPPADADYLFMAFHRAGNVGALPGSGLGLAIAKQAIDLHGGDIQVFSELNAGTTFHVTLPLCLRAQHLTGARLLESSSSAKIGA